MKRLLIGAMLLSTTVVLADSVQAQDGPKIDFVRVLPARTGKCISLTFEWKGRNLPRSIDRGALTLVSRGDQRVEADFDNANSLFRVGFRYSGDCPAVGNSLEGSGWPLEVFAEVYGTGRRVYSSHIQV